MADAVLTNQSVLQELKLLIRDNDNDWMTDLWYESKIYEHFRTDQQNTYTFNKRGTLGDKVTWTYRNDGLKVMFYGLTFTGEDDAEYQVNCNGSVQLTSGTDSNTTLTMTGTEVNFPELIVDVCQYLITHKAQDESVNVGAVSFTPQDEARLINIMEYWRGIRSL